MKTLAIIVPVFNEASIIEQTIVTLEHYFLTTTDWQLIIVDNGSTDATCAIVKQLQSHYANLEYYYIPEPGRGRALRLAALHYAADAYIYVDADIPCEMSDLQNILQPILLHTADLTVGKRSGSRPWIRRCMTIAMRWISAILHNITVHDAQCGVKAFSGELVQTLFSKTKERGYFFDTELLALAMQQHLRVTEVPLHWIERRYHQRKSKITIVRDSINALSAEERILRTCYPKYWVGLILLLVSGGVVTAFFMASAFDLQFTLSEPMPDKLKIIMLGMAGGYVLCSVASHWTRLLPTKLALAIIIGFIMVLSGVSIVTQPLQSQDAYWNLLLAKGFTQYHLNPYTTSPADLATDSWSAPVVYWRDLSMTHGPLWVWFVSAITVTTQSLSQALLSLKLLHTLAWLISLYVFWKILSLHHFTDDKKILWLLLVGLNPLLYQTTIIDIHDDSWLLLAHLLSYYCLKKQYYSTSATLLILAGFIKYVSILLVPIPLWYLIKKYRLRSWKYLLLIGTSSLLVGIVLYLPFGLPWQLLDGLRNEFTERGFEGFSLFGTFSLGAITHWSYATLRQIGIVMAIITLGLLLLKNKPTLAYIIPFATLLYFGTPWFQVWYALWIVLLLPLVIDPWLFVVITIMIPFFTDEFYPEFTSIILLLAVAFGLLFQRLRR